jgi:hypothetical protein
MKYESAEPSGKKPLERESHFVFFFVGKIKVLYEILEIKIEEIQRAMQIFLKLLP